MRRWLLGEWTVGQWAVGLGYGAVLFAIFAALASAVAQ